MNLLEEAKQMLAKLMPLGGEDTPMYRTTMEMMLGLYRDSPDKDTENLLKTEISLAKSHIKEEESKRR